MSLEKYEKKRKKERIKKKVEDNDKSILQKNTTSENVSYAKYNFETAFYSYAIEAETHCIKKKYHFKETFCTYAVKLRTYLKKIQFRNASRVQSKQHIIKNASSVRDLALNSLDWL